MKLLSELKYNLSKYNKLELLIAAVSIILLTWFILSFADIVLNNLTTYTYSKWNLINLIQGIF